MPTVVPRSSSSTTRSGSRPPITHVSKLRALEHRGQVRVDAGGPPLGAQRGELRDAQLRERLLPGRPVREQAVDLLDQHEATGADLIGDPRGDRVGGHLPRRGQRVEGEAGGQQHRGLPTGEPARPREVGAPHGIAG